MPRLSIWIIESNQRYEVAMGAGDRLQIRRAEATQKSGSLTQQVEADGTRSSVFWSSAADVSQSHLELKVDSEGVLLAKDLKSTNGTWVRLSHYKEVAVAPGSELLVGQQLVVQFQRSSGDISLPSGRFSSIAEFLDHLRSQLGDAAADISIVSAPSGESQKPHMKKSWLPLLPSQSYVAVSWRPATLNLAKERLLRTEVVLFNSGATSELALPKEEPWEFLATSFERREVLELARYVAPTDETVLLNGPTGSGKEVLAHDLHHHSRRASGRFIPVNCANMLDHLMEAELFGTKRGAFNDAVDRAGLFEQADGGTIFLDEIGDLPLHLQSKLLRVLQDRKVRRVGDNKEITVNVRIIAATNLDLHRMVAEGKFRSDLLFRLDCVRLNLPELQPSDIRALVPRLLFERARSGSATLADSEVQEIASFAEVMRWPGNARQLDGCLRRYLTFRSPTKSPAENWDRAQRSGGDASSLGAPKSADVSLASRAADSGPVVAATADALPKDLMAAADLYGHLLFLTIAKQTIFPHHRGSFAALGSRTLMTGAGAAGRLRKLLDIPTHAQPELSQVELKIVELRQALECFRPFLP